MYTYRLVGIERRSGTSKKTGKDYDFVVFHCLDEITVDDHLVGQKVEQILLSTINVDAILAQKLKDVNIGQVITIYYNRQGYPCNFDIVS